MSVETLYCFPHTRVANTHNGVNLVQPRRMSGLLLTSLNNATELSGASSNFGVSGADRFRIRFFS